MSVTSAALRLASLGFNVVATVRKLSDGQALLDRAPSDAVRRYGHHDTHMGTPSVATLTVERSVAVGDYTSC